MLVLTGGSPCALCEYTPATNTWVTKAAPPASGAWNDGSWIVNDRVNHLIYGMASASPYSIYKYDVIANTWNPTPVTYMPVNPGAGGCARFLNGRIYVLAGGNKTYFNSYTPSGSTWTTLTGTPKAVGSGASIVTDGSVLYIEPGGSGADSKLLWEYVPDVAAYAPAPTRRNVGAQDAGTLDLGEASFAIAPNPLTSGFVTLSYSLPRTGGAEVAVYNVSGQMVHSQALSAGSEASNVVLDLQHLSNGVYLVKLTSNGFAGTQKLVVRR